MNPGGLARSAQRLTYATSRECHKTKLVGPISTEDQA